MHRMAGGLLALQLLLGCLGAGSAGSTDTVKVPEPLFPPLAPWAGVHVPLNTSSPDNQCWQDSRILYESYRNRVLWAAKMVDASAGSVSGALWASRYQLGHFDACLAAAQGSPVGAQYCLVQVSVRTPGKASAASERRTWASVKEMHPNDHTSAALNGEGLLPGFRVPGDVLVAQCVPASCRPAALEYAMKAAMKAQVQTAEVHVDPRHCTRDEPHRWSVGAVVFWSVLCALVVLTLLGRGWWDWRRHVAALGSPDAALEGMELAALSGLRCLTTILALALHRIVISSSGANSNEATDVHTLTSVFYTPVFNGPIFNTSFLFFSGLLAFLCKTKYGVLKSFAIRYLRLIPLYLLVILFTSAVLPGLTSGPLWGYIIGREGEACSTWWWANLLFINNYTPITSDKPGCLFHSWFLAVEMQLFLLSLLLRPRARGWACLLLLALLGVLPPLLATLYFRWPALFVNRPLFVEHVLDGVWFKHGYIPAYMRTTAFLMGIAAGKLLLQLNQVRGFRLGLAATWLLLVSGVVTLVALMSSSVWLQHPLRPYSALEAALYAGFSPALWSAALGAIVVALVFGQQTWVRDLLSWQPLVTLSRLSYGVYLTSYILQTASVATWTNPRGMRPLDLTSDFAADVVVFYLLSFVLHVLVEAPARLATRDLLERPNKKSSSGGSSSLTQKKEL